MPEPPTLDAAAHRREETATFKLLARARSLWQRASFDAHYMDEYTVAEDDPERVAARDTALAAFGQDLAADGARGVLVISPVLESWDHYHWEHIHDHVTRAGRAAGFTVVDPQPAWRRTFDSARLRFPGDNLHYRPGGYRALASAIAPRIPRFVP